MTSQGQEGIFSTFTFAIGLICIASLYIFIMIFKAYRQVNSTDDSSKASGISDDYYEYMTESYDFQNYQSQNEEEGLRNLDRGFNYNESIVGSAHGNTSRNYGNNEEEF
jgi:hypothetical protein